MTPEQLRAIARIPADTAVAFAGPITAAMGRFGVNTTRRQACHVAQAAHESAGFTRMTENLNYTPAALLAIWPKRFAGGLAQQYGRVDGVQKANQQMIANVAYANRMGNGSIESGDGWRYRGRGPGQLTGKDNYMRCGHELGVDLVEFPEQVALARLGCLAFAWFWQTHGLNELADTLNVARISAIINGGDLGLQARIDLTDTALNVLTGAIA